MKISNYSRYRSEGKGRGAIWGQNKEETEERNVSTHFFAIFCRCIKEEKSTRRWRKLDRCANAHSHTRKAIAIRLKTVIYGHMDLADGNDEKIA